MRSTTARPDRRRAQPGDPGDARTIGTARAAGAAMRGAAASSQALGGRPELAASQDGMGAACFAGDTTLGSPILAHRPAATDARAATLGTPTTLCPKEPKRLAFASGCSRL